MNRIALAFFFVAIILSLVAIGAIEFSAAQTSGTSVSGIIVTDTTWTQSGSPYSLIGNLLVNNGVTLYIQPGVTVNIGSYYIMVNGTLQAVGNYDNPVIFNSNTNGYSSVGQITFTQFSPGWNNTASTGSIIKNAVINSALFLSNSAEIIQNKIYCGINVQSTITAQQTGTAVIQYNFIQEGLAWEAPLEAP